MSDYSDAIASVAATAESLRRLADNASLGQHVIDRSALIDSLCHHAQRLEAAHEVLRGLGSR